MTAPNPSVSRNPIRNFFWPIYGREEHMQFLPMACMIALILFNYTVARNLKDAQVLNSSGAETLTYLKLWIVTPSAILFFIIYSKLANVLHKRSLFYAIVIPFVLFFGLFALVIYPNQDALLPTTSADWLESVLPQGLYGLVAVYRYWHFSLFYMCAELWGSAVSALLFWQFANDVISVNLAKRFYAHFYLLANVAVVAAGLSTRYFSKLGSHMSDNEVEAWGISLNFLMGLFVLSGILSLMIYHYLNKNVFSLEKLEAAGEPKAQKKKKAKLSIGESIKFLSSNTYVLLIAILVLAYGISINLTEVHWKAQVKMLFPTKNEYSSFAGMHTSLVGLFAIVAIFIGSAIMRKTSWFVGAIATPLTFLITGIPFFLCIIFPDAVSPITGMLGLTPLAVAVYVGLAQNVLSKSIKYALFDPTKEMSYIPLDDESKIKGKAAVDVIGGRMGKSGGGVILQVLIATFGTLIAVVPHTALIFLLILLIWMYAVKSLSIRFTALTSKTE